MADVAKLHRVRPVVEDLVDECRELLRMAEAGELQSLTFFGDVIGEEGPEVHHGTAGTTDAPAALFAFECWKAGVIENTKR